MIQTSTIIYPGRRDASFLQLILSFTLGSFFFAHNPHLLLEFQIIISEQSVHDDIDNNNDECQNHAGSSTCARISC